MLTFLHLSDLHITTADAGNQFDQDFKIREALLEDLGKEDRTKFDGILVTGDIAYQGRADEFKRAKEWLELVRKVTESSPEALFVVPGNHDVNRAVVSKESSLWDLHQGLRRQQEPQERAASLAKKLHDPFDFLAALAEYRTFASEYDCSTTAKELSWLQVLEAGRELEDGSVVRFHGLNSALLSDGEDTKANLLLDDVQFRHFDNKPEYVNVVLCHHPHSWLMDSNEANDYFRNQAQIVLSGHEHDNRCYMEDDSLRVFAGAVHPNRRERRWEPSYNVLRLSVQTSPERMLVANVENRVWLDKDKCFGPHAQKDGKLSRTEHIKLRPWTKPRVVNISGSITGKSTILGSLHGKEMTATPTSDTILAARRKLIVHFFRLGVIDRYEAVMKAGAYEKGDDDLEGQARWARVFERAEKNKKLGALWNAVAEKDRTLQGQKNPFE